MKELIREEEYNRNMKKNFSKKRKISNLNLKTKALIKAKTPKEAPMVPIKKGGVTRLGQAEPAQEEVQRQNQEQARPGLGRRLRARAQRAQPRQKEQVPQPLHSEEKATALGGSQGGPGRPFRQAPSCAARRGSAWYLAGC